MLYLSVLVHEFCHALTTKQLGYDVPKIELNAMGGLAYIKDLNTASAKEEFLIIAAGPLSNLMFALDFFILNQFYPSHAIKMLMVMNLFLVAFNLIPIAPLDGNKILKSVLYFWYKDKLRAIQTSYVVGMGTASIVLGTCIYFQQYSMCIFFLFASLLGWAEYEQSKMLENKDRLNKIENELAEMAKAYKGYR